MAIKIPVSADFDAEDVKKQIAAINAQFSKLGDTVAKANKLTFDPITLQSKDDLKYFIAQTEKLMKLQGGMRSKMVDSGQGGKNPLFVNWNQMYLNESTRLKRQKEMLEFYGNTFDEISAPGGKPPTPPAPTTPVAPAKPPKPPKQPRTPGQGGGNRPPPSNQGGGNSAPGGSGGNPWVNQGTNILQSGLRAAGPVGGVAANAVGTGMSAGFGAGLMGLVGGMVALGVGQIVSSVKEHIDQAEQNDIAYDRLKRTLGDVNVSFEGLKTLIQDNANNLGVTFDEAGKLGQAFTKLSNLSDEQYKQLGSELSTSVGFARGFGLDPEQSTSVFGSLRGARVTGNDQDTRRMAILIGETIGKSGAFAKADEVMEAIGNFAVTQTRYSMSKPNVLGYTGEYSALVGSGMPGLDPAGTSSLLNRINSSLTNGGAHGEASQFFTAMVSNRMGLDPIQSAIMREGGAFATDDQMFGKGSAAARYGIKGPRGNKTFLQETLSTLRDKYKNPELLAMATSQHLGIGINQAMALLDVSPNKMGDIQTGLASAGVDMSSLNSAGIESLAKVYTGSNSDRQGVAQSLYGRTGDQALTSTESDRLRTVMAGNDVDAQKKMLTELISTRDQEKTQGSDIRDSKNILENIKTAVADKLIPLVTEMRHGIMSIAGVGKNGMTPQKIEEQVIRAEWNGKGDAIKQRYKAQIDEQTDRLDVARANTSGIPTADEAKLPRDQQLKAVTARQAKALQEMKAAQAEIDRLNGLQDNELAANTAQEDTAVDSMYTGSGTPGAAPANWRPGVTPVGRISDIKDPKKQAQVASFLEAISASEGANYNSIVGGGHFDDFKDHPNIRGLSTADGPSAAAGRYQFVPETWDRVKRKIGLKNFGPESQDRAAIELLKEAGALEDIENGDIDKALSKLGAIWQGLPTGTSKNQGHRSKAYFTAQYNEALKRNSAQLPADNNGSGNNQSGGKGTVDVNIHHLDASGKPIAPTQTLKTTLSAPTPSGVGG